MEKRAFKKFYYMIFSICTIICFMWQSQLVKAGTYDNAIDFWNRFGNNGTQNGNYFYFCTKGYTAQGGVKYLTIGYSVSVSVNNTNLSIAQFKLQGGYDIDTRSSGGYTFVLRRIPVTKVLSRLQLANDDKVLYLLYTDKQRYTFNSIMTITENGSAKGSVSETSNGKVSTSGEVYTTLNGIKSARSWANSSDLNNYFNKTVEVQPVNPLSVSRISVSGNHVYNVGLKNGDYTYYVKSSTLASLSFTASSEFSSANFKPNANIFHTTGYGVNDSIDVRTQMNNNSSLYWKNSGPIGVTNASAGRSGNNLSTTISGSLDIPNEKVVYVYPQAKVFLGGSITSNNGRRSDAYIACDTVKHDSSKRVMIIGDSVAPTINVNGTQISAKDTGSGVKYIKVLRMDGSTYATYNSTGCTIPMGKFMIYAEDNVGNPSQKVSVSNSVDVKLSVCNNNGWNPSNVCIQGTTSNGLIGAIVVWCPGLGQDENSESALYLPVNGMNVTANFNAKHFYSTFDGSYQLYAKTVVFDRMGKYQGEDTINFLVNLDFTIPAIGWGQRNEAEMKFGKPGESYTFSCISCDYNKNNAYGTSYTSGIQSLTISNADTGELLSNGNYDSGINHHKASVATTKNLKLKIQAVDYAGNVNTGHTFLRFDSTIPKVSLSVIDKKGVQVNGWWNGDLTLQVSYEDVETGVQESEWRTISRYDGSIYDSSIDVQLEGGVSYWKKYYPGFMNERSTRGTSKCSFTQEGSYTVEYHAIDGCENEGIGKMDIKMDKTPPKLTYSDRRAWNPERITIRADDGKANVNEVSGLMKTTCYYLKDSQRIFIANNGEASTSYLNPMVDFFQHYTKYRIDGSHKFLLESTDYAENINSMTITLSLDLTPPEFSVIAEGGMGLSKWNPKGLTFRFTDATSGIRYYKIEEERGGRTIKRAEKGNCLGRNVASVIGTASMGKDLEVPIDLEGYEGGTFHIYIEDEAGNVLVKEYQPLWDADKPNCTIECFGEMNGWNPQYVNLTFKDNTSGLLQIKTNEVSKDGKSIFNKDFTGNKNTVNSIIETIHIKEFDESKDRLYWFASDQVENQNEGVFHLKIDKTAPTGDVTYDEENRVVTISNIVEERSGVDKAWVEVFREGNTKNRQTILLNEISKTKWEGKIELEGELYKERSLIEVRISDKAGNTALLRTLELDGFMVTASIHRSLSPREENSPFKAGEQGYVSIRTYGYPDKVEIQFTPLLSQYDTDLEGIVYPLTPKAEDELNHYFYIPLYVPEGVYSVQVIGYKGDKSKKVPLALTVRDTILNHFRTRIRG